MKFDQYMALEREEMLRHKWLLSEKAGRDLGQAALFDWIERHADAFHHYITVIRGETIECGDACDGQARP